MWPKEKTSHVSLWIIDNRVEQPEPTQATTPRSDIYKNSNNNRLIEKKEKRLVNLKTHINFFQMKQTKFYIVKRILYHISEIVETEASNWQAQK